MTETLIVKPLGLVLQKAGLISLEQVKIALKAKKSLPHYRIGEILAIRGWIKPETANFFAEQWPSILAEQNLQPLGQYLKAAGFISDRQISKILEEQTHTHLKFGDYAVLQGLISKTTLSFFLQQLDIIRDNIITETTLNDYKAFNKIESHILHNQKCDPSDLLKFYQKIRREGELISTNDALETELLKSSLIAKYDNKVRVASSKYRKVFNQDWIEEELVFLQPYTKIRLRMFGLEKLASLPHKVLNAVNHWTDNQPFLTQKIYHIIRENQVFIGQGEEINTIDDLVQKYIIKNWERGIAATHFQTIQQQFLDNKDFSTVSLLKNYQHLWQQGEVTYDRSPQQMKLLDLGVAKLEKDLVSISNPIYHAVFDRVWIEQKLTGLGITFASVPELEYKPLPREIRQHVNSTSASFVRRIWIPILSTIVLLASGAALYWFGQQFIQTNSQKQLLNQGDIQLKSQNYSQALALYNQTLRQDKDMGTVWLNRGYALEGLEEYELMLQSCTSATVIQPQLELAWDCRGKALFYLEQYEEAVEAWKTAIALNPQNAVAWVSYGESLYEVGQHQASLNAIKRAISLLKDRPQAELSLLVAYNGQLDREIIFCLMKKPYVVDNDFKKVRQLKTEYNGVVQKAKTDCQS